MKEELEPLSGEWSRVLDAERARPPVPAAQVSRVAARIDASFQALSGAASVGVASGVAAKVLLVSVGLVVGGVGGAVLHAQFATPNVVQVVVERRVEVRVEVPVEVPVEVLKPARVVTPPTLAAPVVPVRTTPQVKLERLLIEQATSALSRGKGAEAVAACDEHTRQFGDGQLAEERESLAIRALVLLGRRDEALTRARAFQLKYPDSLLSEVVEAAVQ